jgi:hypothetical protein
MGDAVAAPEQGRCKKAVVQSPQYPNGLVAVSRGLKSLKIRKKTAEFTVDIIEKCT